MKIITGINVPPRIVGWARALLAAVAVAGLEAAVKFINGSTLGGNWDLYAPLIVLLLRGLEGEVDHTLKPNQNTAPDASGQAPAS